jgi:hypothetical protein
MDFADVLSSVQPKASNGGQPVQPTSLLTQSIGEGFYKQLCAEEGFESSLVLVAVRCRFSWDTECEAGGER